MSQLHCHNLSIMSTCVKAVGLATLHS